MRTTAMSRPSPFSKAMPVLATAVVWANMRATVASAFMICSRTCTAARTSSLRVPSGSGAHRYSHLSQYLRATRRRLKRRRRDQQREETRASPTMLFEEKRPEEIALGDRLVSEERPESDGGPGRAEGGLALEPPGFLKRLFSVPKNVRRTVAVGDVVVPVIGARDDWGGIRQRLVNRGVYPGVEYRIVEVTVRAVGGNEQGTAARVDSSKSVSLASTREAPAEAFDDGELVFTMRPVYPLVKRLERQWPVQVPAREFPVLLTPFAYNAATAWAALTTSLSTLTVGFVLSQALTFSDIPSHSMEPTLQVNDVVLVEKVSRASLLHRNDIVFFNPPPALRKVVAEAGGTLSSRDLFVKRIAAIPGDIVTVNAQGSVQVVTEATKSRPKQRLRSNGGSGGSAWTGVTQSISEQEQHGEEATLNTLPQNVLQRIRVTDGGEVVPPGTVFVLGDNPAASMDSRVWGQLDQREIVGHPLIRIFPLRGFGLLP